MKSEYIEKLCIIFYSMDIPSMIEAMQYFMAHFAFNKPITNQSGLICHAHFVNSTLIFTKNQIEWYNDYCTSDKENNMLLSMTLLKKVMMPEIKLNSGEISELLLTIIDRIFNDVKMFNNPSRIMRFYIALFYYILGNNKNDLANYFLDEHDEPF